VLGIRKDTSKSSHYLLKSGDLFDIVLVQMKGGSAKSPSTTDVHRLRAVARHYRARDVILFGWKRGEGCTFQRLGRGVRWLRSSAAELFG
jgi:hypothetical protein